MDAFISWTLADRDVKNVIVEKLRAAGVSCWDSDVDCLSDFPEECTAAIRRCSVFIVIVSDACMAKGHVINEVKIARDQADLGKLNILIYKITDSPYRGGFEFMINHITYVTGNYFERQQSLADTGVIDLLVDRAVRLLERRKNGDPEKPFDVYRPQPAGMKLTGTGYFVEHSRDQLLDQMAQALEKSNVLILRELAGFGKRSAVRQFVQLHTAQYNNALLLTNTCGSLRDFLLSGLSFSNICDQRFRELEGDALVEEKLKLLEKLDQQTLLVIQDVRLEGLPDTDLCQRLLGLPCRIILLTQDQPGFYEDWFPVLRVGRMADEHLQQLFFHHYARACQEEQEQLRAPLCRYFDNIGGHTKTVELTATVLNRELYALPEQLPEYLSMEGNDGSQLQDRVMQQLTNIFNMAQPTEQEYTAMLVAACLAVPDLSEQHYCAVLAQCGICDDTLLPELERRRWLDRNLQNRTVSIEPLLARIVISQSAGKTQVLGLCMRHLFDQYDQLNMLSVFAVTLADMHSRLEHFFRLTGFASLQSLTELIRRASIDERYCDSEAIRNGLAAFEAQYPAARFCDEPSEELPEDRTQLEYELQYLFRTRLLPLARLHQLGAAHALNNFSDASNRLISSQLQQTGPIFDIHAITGISPDELAGFVQELRRYTAEIPVADEKDLTAMLLAEALSCLESIQRHDVSCMQLSIQNLLRLTQLRPELLDDQNMADWFCLAMLFMANVYLQSGACEACCQLCRQALETANSSIMRLRLLQYYILASRTGQRYTQSLYDAYREMLTLFDKHADALSAKRADIYPDKKLWLLDFAVDLAYGEQAQESLTHFDAAQKLGAALLPDHTVSAADSISRALIRMGQFALVPDFLRRHFGPAQIRQLETTVCEEALPLLETFRSLQTAAAPADPFEYSDDPLQYVSEYYRYSRKHNGLWEQKYLAVAERASEFDFSELSDRQITEEAQKLRLRAKREPMKRLMPEAFALASEAGQRVLGYRHHFVQLAGAAVMADGKIAEIPNGEGKTYTIVPVAFLFYLYGQKVYVTDQSAYLSQRNQNWMQGVYELLGMKSLYVDEDQTKLRLSADVLYMRVRTLVFCFLHQEAAPRNVCPFPTDCVIIDEADTVLVDSAQTPCKVVHSRRTPTYLRYHQLAWKLAQQISFDERYYSLEDNRVQFRPELYALLEQQFGMDWSDISGADRLRQIENIVRAAIICCDIQEKDRDYFIHRGQPVREDPATGEFCPMHESYHYFLCRKHNLDDTEARRMLENRPWTINTISLRDFFRKFRHLCGTTATAASFRDEFREIYGLDYVAISPHLPCQRKDTMSPLYITMRDKDQAILQTVREKYAVRQPVLLITQSIQESEKYDRLLTRAQIPHQLLNARNAAEAANVIACAGIPGSVLVANALAGRGADIKLGGDPELMTRRELAEMGADLTKLDSFLFRLPTVEQASTPLYRQYYSILEKNRHLTALDRAEAEAAGGLYVIGTSFFPEPRTQLQTCGRSGRQGAPGESRIFYSLADQTLTALMPTLYAQWTKEWCQDVGNVDSAYLRQIVKACQTRLHRRHFAAIRAANDHALYIDKARPDFIEPRYGLEDGTLSAEELLERWLTDPRILRQLQLLQEGEKTSGSKALDTLFQQEPRLKNVRGNRAGQVLLQLFLEHLRQQWPVSENLFSQVLAQLQSTLLLNTWMDYIACVESLTEQSGSKKEVLETYLAQEKLRLLLQLLDQIFFKKVYPTHG